MLIIFLVILFPNPLLSMDEPRLTIGQTMIVNEVPLFSCHKIDMNYIYQYDIETVLKRYKIVYQVSNVIADKAEMDLKRYLYEMVMQKRHPRMYDHHTADLWHVFVLHSREYYTFCFQCYGQMIHHDPSICDKLHTEYPKQEESLIHRLHFQEPY